VIQHVPSLSDAVNKGMSTANDVPIAAAPEMAFAVHSDIEPQLYHLCQFEQVVVVFAHRYFD